MRQGRASSSGRGGTKVEPRAHRVSETAVSQIGTALGNHATEDGKMLKGAGKPLYEGRGLEAPMVGVTCHRSGSQKRS
jgi:hypothetical protein